ncbi:NUDIX domain-containing protein [Embleya sp. NBC_00896]|uniref:NUDIX domain-containing protein n=1 Tax=Embleya sp. NBC_00896 TaxID=2975961 RepID=UPI0038703760|nr:NUDIX hydrolase [Embleya sp. NBC_00896]
MNDPGTRARIVDTAEAWPVAESETPFKGRVWSMRSEVVEMPDGSSARRDYLAHPGAVGIVALDEQGRLLVLRQYRHPVRHKLWEIPAGLLDVPGENPLHAAQRELFEEAHYEARVWNVLLDIYTTPGSSDEAIRVFLARGLSESRAERFAVEHEEVGMELAWLPLAEAVELVLAGELHNPILTSGALALAAAQASAEGLDGLRDAQAPWPARPYS